MSRHKPRMTKEWIEVLFDYGIDKGNRRIFLFDDIDTIPIGMVIKGLYYMDSESQTEPIELFIGSYGGSEYDMFALYDAIRTLKSPVHTTAIGKCMSAAPLLVCAGEKGYRYATPNTFFMVHQSWGEYGVKRTDELKIDMKHLEDKNKRWYDLMEKHTKKDGKFWKKLCEQVGDKYFDAYQAQEWGMVDHVWDEKGGN
jgi:ATP-dependent Clp protease protease subunit